MRESHVLRKQSPRMIGNLIESAVINERQPKFIRGATFVGLIKEFHVKTQPTLDKGFRDL